MLYYSSDIMKHVFPTKAGYIALMITGVNFLMVSIAHKRLTSACRHS